MKKKEEKTIPVAEFDIHPPKVYIDHGNPEPLYEKAFLSREDKELSDYARNTTTHD